MQKKWVAGGLVAGMMVLGGVAVLGAMAARKADPAAPASAQAKAGDGARPDVALQFTSSEVVRPALVRMAAVVEFSGPLVAPQTAIVRAKAGGTLLALSVAEGSRVGAGQALGQIELAELGSRVAERSALLESARAAAVQAERSHASNERLAAQQFISSNALESSRAALDTARANLAAAQASLDTTRVGLRDGRLVAPIAGIVARRHALPGEKVSPEQQVLTIVDLARLELAGTVGTHEVSRIRPGLPVQVRVEGLDEPVSGRVARIAPAAEPGTRSIGVTIELANPGERLRAGQYALVRAELPDDVERLTLPATAVGSTSGQDHVWLIENGRLAWRAVTLGRRDERQGRVEVLQGLTPSATVLAARFDNLRDGASATVVAAGTAAVASAAASAPQPR
ncbi:MAG: efflux RND transporter periplasmic adaptor subunit [Rubrivivax sp.]